MIVKCVSFYNENGEKVNESYWLRIGADYTVLSIEQNSQGNIYYALEPFPSQADTIGFFHYLGFEVVDETWPPNWVKESSNGGISIAPKAWQHADFWEKFHEGEMQAKKIYREERAKILKAIG